MPVSISGNGTVTGIDAGSLDVVSTDDTGAPWQVPYLDGGAAGSLAAADEAQALAIAAGLSNASNLVSFKSSLLTAASTFSLAANAVGTISGLSITHTPASSSNLIHVWGFLVASNHNQGVETGRLATLVVKDSTAISVGDAAGSRARVFQPSLVGIAASDVASLAFAATETAGNTSSRTYHAAVRNLRNGTRTFYINRSDQADGDSAQNSRGASIIFLVETKP